MLKFFGISKTKKVHSEENLELKQIDSQIQNLKKQRKNLTPPHVSSFPSGTFFMGVPVAIPNCYYIQPINYRELSSLDRQIDQLEEVRNQHIHPVTIMGAK